MNAYTVINHASNEGTIGSDVFDIEFQNICARNNINIIVLDAQTQTIKTSISDYELLSRQLLSYLFEKDLGTGKKMLSKEESYEMLIIKDRHLQQDYVDMWGVLDNGNLFLFRTPLEGIRESVELANRFLAYVGIGATIFSALIILVVSGKITEPVMELTHISEKMIQLDFDAKYTGKSKTEIALLGQNINELSETLETNR